MTVPEIGVVGGGAWGTALGHLAAIAGRSTLIWARDPGTVEAISSRHENTRRLPGCALDPRLRATGRLEEACAADAVLLAVPAQHVREVARRMADLVRPGAPVISCAKGIEAGTGLLMSEVLAEAAPDTVAGCLSGPTFAAEAVRGMPTAATLAFPDPAVARALAGQLGSSLFRPYMSSDVIGAETAGAVKNVLAIACGIAAGRGFGENTRAALITRGLAETTRLAVVLGGRGETLAGLAGLGDVALTCVSRQSRNYRFGEAVGRGSPDAGNGGGVIEGRHTAAAVVRRARSLGVDTPICAAVDIVLNHGADLDRTIEDLLNRPLQAEEARGPARGR